MSERRHRIYKHEIPEVVEGLKLRLEQHLKARKDREKAEIAFNLLHRLTREKGGRPKYPKFSWDYISYFIEFV